MDHQRVSKVAQVLVVLSILACLIIGGLIIELIHETVVVVLSLASIFHVHLVDHFLVFFGAVVRLVVLLSVEFVFGFLLSVPLLLLVDEGLVQLEVRVGGVTSFFSLSSAKVDIVVELVLFAFTLLLQSKQIFFIALQCGESSFISYGHLFIFFSVAVAE